MAIKINNIKATNIDLTPAIKEYVVTRINSLEKLVDQKDTSINTDIEVGKTSNHHKSGDIFRAEINLYIGGKNFRSESVNKDLYSSIDEAKEDLSRILNNFKDKSFYKKKRGGALLKRLLRGLKS